MNPRNRRDCGRIAVSVLLCILFGMAPNASVAQETRESLAHEVEKMEDMLRYVSYRAHFSVKEWSGETERFEDTGSYMDANVLTSGVNGGMARIDMTDQVLQWIDGPSPRSRHIFSGAYNGEYGTIATYREGTPEQMSDISFGEIVGDRPILIENYRENVGLNHTLNHCFPGESLSAVLRNPNYDVTVERDGSFGAPLVRVSIKGMGSLERRIFLDPSRGYAVIRRDRSVRGEDGLHTKLYESVATDAQEIGNGMWFPRTIETFWTNLKSSEEYAISIEDVVLNPEVEESAFQIAFPPGFTVEDERFGTRYVVGKQGAGLGKREQSPIVQSRKAEVSPSPFPAFTTTRAG